MIDIVAEIVQPDLDTFWFYLLKIVVDIALISMYNITINRILMSDRFYTQMLEATGWCPGFKHTTTLEEYERKFGKINRRRKVAWTDEAKQQAIELYTAEEPTPENSMEIVKEIAAELGESPNGVRMILTKGLVYM